MPNITSTEPFVFTIDNMVTEAKKHSGGYYAAMPFPHVVIDDFLPVDVANRLLDEFPDPDSPVWLDWKTRDPVHQPMKQGMGHASRMDGMAPYLQNVLFTFNSFPFLTFLEGLTGIRKLLPDPHFYGGGVHQILNGGKLSVHTDFNDLSQLDLYRRINVLLYLNKDWKPEYAGDLELWDSKVTRCVKSVAPIFNRLVVFNTNKKSFHGHPKPLDTPENVTRKSIALYYYTAKKALGEKYDDVTDWQETI